MQIAGLDLYLNHGILGVGSTEWLPRDLAFESAPVAAGASHLVVRVQAQTGPVKVRIFLESDVQDVAAGMCDFVTVFDGHLLLPDGRLVVGDVMGESRFVTSLIGDPGLRAVRVAVDDPHERAKAVAITIGTAITDE
ncbi:hypothetical protein ACIRST_37945 [Kitasatospora sp. NPDC101447]|uniref:hypothetical protein n=1 Tax=Kitasatospora sp. NPDC101447 TaxID=3364102 RepID=UPI00381AE18B